MSSSVPIPCPQLENATLVALPGEVMGKELRAHLEVCPTCTAAHARSAALVGVLRSLQAPTAPGVLAESVRQALVPGASQDRALAALRELPDVPAPDQLEDRVEALVGGVRHDGVPARWHLAPSLAGIVAAAALVLLLVRPGASEPTWSFEVERGSLDTIDPTHRALLEGMTGLGLPKGEAR